MAQFANVSDFSNAMRGYVKAVESEEKQYLVTSHSIDGTFDSCPRRFEFRHVVGVIPDIEDSGFAADAGTAVHEALQQWARDPQSQANIKKAFLTLMIWWPWKLEDEKKRQDSRNFGNAVLLLELLIKSDFWDDWEVATLADGSHAIELPFRINHTSLGSFIHPRTGLKTFIATQGKMDFIVRNRKTGVLMVMDLKTTILDEDAHEAAFRFSGQAGQYGLVLSAAVGHDFRRNGIDVCYFVAEFATEGPRIRPFIYHLDPEEVQDAISTKVDKVNRMLGYARQAWWPRKTSGCNFFTKPCGFLDVCHRREYDFLLDWFAADDRFKFKERIYEPYWILEA